jgi:prevent-host-death family protein
MNRIGVRELRQHASRWLARVQSGETFEITDRGRPVARLIPVPATDWDDLVAAGKITPATRSLADIEPLPRDYAPSLSAVLAEDREDSR